MNSKQCVQPPCLLEAPFLEYSIHQCPKQMLKELRLIFPDLQNTQNSPTLYIIPTFQPCQNDLLCEVTPAVEAEKDQLLENVSFSTLRSPFTITLHLLSLSLSVCVCLVLLLG
eukprot:Sdes_comp19317_c0_seq2m10454